MAHQSKAVAAPAAAAFKPYVSDSASELIKLVRNFNWEQHGAPAATRAERAKAGPRRPASGAPAKSSLH